MREDKSPSGAKTIHLGLIGYPLGHSRSPQLHEAALAHYHLKGEYRLFAVPPLPEGAGQIETLVDGVRRGELDGLNVTIPHKPSVLAVVDRLSRVARAVGAVNTLYRDGHGLVVGDNSDVPGFLADLQDFLGEPLTAGKGLVLGAGGSARAAVYALARSGWQVTVLARRLGQAQELVSDLRIATQESQEGEKLEGELGEGIFRYTQGAVFEVTCAGLSVPELARAAPGTDLIVNATPLGMHPHPGETPWFEEVRFPPGAALYDLVYNPPITRLMGQARAAGLRARNGAGMLAAQAALSFARWTGCAPPFEVMRAVMARLESSS